MNRRLELSALHFVLIVWLCFVARGFFYCSFLPLWEGYDEWAHFAFVQHLVTGNGVLVDRNEPISREVQASMQLAPAPWATGAPFTTHDDFWRLPEVERDRRIKAIPAIPAAWARQPDPNGTPTHEALQPPLYYWFSSLTYRAVADRPLLDRVFLLRYLAILVCSGTIPIIFLLGRRVSPGTHTAAFAIILFAILPELLIDCARVGNECVGILIYSWLTYLAVIADRQTISARHAIWTGVALGLGLITKAYFLTCLPAMILLYLWCTNRKPGHRRNWLLRAVTVFGTALAIGGWWYVRNHVLTGTWSGLLESAKLVHYSVPQYIGGISHVDWRNAVDSILDSHIWFGAWSGLGVRSWAYSIIFMIVAAGLGGVAVIMRHPYEPQQRARILPLVLIYGFFWLGQLYNVLLLFLTKGASTSMGWYMYAVVAAEIILLLMGVQALLPARSRRGALATIVFLFGALDIYTVHFVSIPYYVGLTAHGGNGHGVPVFRLSQLHGVGVSGIFQRLSWIKPSWLTPHALEASWLFYLLATFGLIYAAFRAEVS